MRIKGERCYRELAWGLQFAGGEIRFVTEANSSRMTTRRNYYFGNSFPDAWNLRGLEIAKDCSLDRGRRVGNRVRRLAARMGRNVTVHAVQVQLIRRNKRAIKFALLLSTSSLLVQRN